jgi:hypothetical protein
MFYYRPGAFKERQLLRSVQPQRSNKSRRTDVINCQSCKFLVECEHPKKSYDFLCNKYEELPELSDSDYLSLLAFDGKDRKDYIAEEEQAISSIEHMIEQAINDQSSGIQTDFTLEDQDIPLPKNFFDFYFNKDFESERRPFPKQIEISMNYLTEICYSCSDEKYARNIPTDAKIDDIQDRVTFLEHGVCPKCKQTKFDMWNKYDCRKADTLALIAGQRSGKDYEIAFLYPYQDARMLKLRSPAKALNIAPGTVLHSTFTATTFYQARDTTWAPYVENIEKSKWFKMYHSMLDHVGHKKGKKLYDFGKEAIIWNYHGLTSAIKSPDVRNLRGVARRAANITELGWFYTKSKGSVRLDPDEVLNALSRSMLTMRAGYRQCLEQGKFDTPSIMLTVASSPSSIKDKAMRLLKESERNLNIYPAHYNVYQMNPGIKPEDLDGERIADYTAYKRDYLAIPPNAVKAFIPDRRLLLNCIDPSRPNAIKSKPRIVIAPSGAKLTAADVTFPTKNVDKESPKILFLDGGSTNNSFAMCLAHIVADEDKNGRDQFYTVVDGLFEVIPEKNKPVDYVHILDEIIIPICEEFNVVMVAADRYAGTIHHLQTIDQELGIDTLRRSIVYHDFVKFKQALLQSTIDLPQIEIKDYNVINELGQKNYPQSFNSKPVAHLLIQSVTVEDLMGKKVDKGDGFTDDLFYSLVGAFTVCNDPELMETFMGDGVEEASQDELVAVSRNYEGRSSDISIRGGQNQGNELIAVSGSYRDR